MCLFHLFSSLDSAFLHPSLHSSFSSQTHSSASHFTMLGMMNSPSDSVEFYACNPGKSGQQLSAEDTKSFTSAKEKPQTAYTQDGRLIVDGKAVEGKEAASLWTGVLLRSAVQQIPIVNDKKGKKEVKNEKEETKEEITPIDEPTLTTAPPQNDTPIEETSQ